MLSTIFLSSSSIKESSVFFPSIKLKIEFFSLLLKASYNSLFIFNYFSLSMAVIVSLSLQEIFGIIGVPRYSPIRASTCFLIKGVKCKVVGVLAPYTSSKYLNYSLSLIPL
jgi:hypothetical protein